MVDWLQALFTSTDSVAHIVLLYALVISVGIGLGRLKLGGISLGVTFVLFAGILAGHVGFTGTPNVLTFIQDFGSQFKDRVKAFINGKNPKTKLAGRVLLGAAIGMTLLGNFLTLFDFNKYKGKKPHAASSLIDESKEKVVC